MYGDAHLELCESTRVDLHVIMPRVYFGGDGIVIDPIRKIPHPNTIVDQ